MLVLNDVRKTFGAIVAVDGLSLEVAAGEVFGLLGPNGAGKSTSIGMSIGMIAPDAGRITIGGAGSPRDPTARRALGVAPQSLALYDELTARENLSLFGRLYGMHGPELRRRVDELLELVGLAERAADRVGGFSGGMKRRLNLAGALVHDPGLILLDEPTAGVDPQSRNSILELVRRLAGAGKTIVYTTHYMEEASKLCDRVGVIDKGSLMALGTVHELIARHGGASVVNVVRGEQSERFESSDPVREVARLMQADPGISSIHIDRPDLESVFLSLTGRRLRE